MSAHTQPCGKYKCLMYPDGPGGEAWRFDSNPSVPCALHAPAELLRRAEAEKAHQELMRLIAQISPAPPTEEESS